MRTLSFLLWTAASVGLGIWMATVPVGGRTPWEHVKRAWPESGVTLPDLPGIASIRPGLPATAPAPAQAEGRSPRISERHTTQERDAVNRLVTRRGEK